MVELKSPISSTSSYPLAPRVYFLSFLFFRDFSLFKHLAFVVQLLLRSATTRSIAPLESTSHAQSRKYDDTSTATCGHARINDIKRHDDTVAHLDCARANYLCIDAEVRAMLGKQALDELRHAFARSPHG